MSIVFLVAGSLAILIAIFANRLGLDASPGWGGARLALLVFGLAAYGLSALLFFAKRFRGSNRDAAAGSRSVLARFGRAMLSPLIGLFFGILVCIGVALYAFWYSSAGRFPAFPVYANDYIQLGESFLHGQLSLLEQPDPALKALPNPYDYQQRLNIPYHWDASYYGGRYYLYWGPVPALVFAAAEGLTHAPPSAALMVDLAYIGLIIVVLAMLFLLYRHFFPEAPGLSPGLFALLALVNLPFLFLLGNPQIYHASIIFGQFFLLLGFLGWVIYICAGKSAGLVIAGLGWGLAVGSRVNLAVSVAIVLVLALVWLGRESGWKLSWGRQGSLLIPLALCGFALGAYNFVRFGNPLETGQKYQLTIPVAHSSYFSLAYLPTNLYIYLAYPINLVAKFPFVKSALFDAALLPKWIGIPAAMSFDHNVFGVFSSAPGLWLLGLAVPLFILALRSGGFRSFPSKRNYFFAMVALAGLGQIFFLLVFFFSAERYIPDFYIPWVIGAAMLVWQADEMLKPRFRLRFGFWLIVSALVLCTAGIGIFGGFGVPPQLFHSFNPALFNRLASYWNDRSVGLITPLARVYNLLLNTHH